VARLRLTTAFHSDNKDNQYGQYQDAMDDPNKANLGHEVLAGGAAFAAMKVFEDRQRKEGEWTHCFGLSPYAAIIKIITGKPVTHEFAKEALAALAGAEVDRFAETTGADWIDRERAKRETREHCEGMYNEHYGGQDQYDPSQQDPPPGIQGNW
jgi:hypothetical protein